MKSLRWAILGSGAVGGLYGGMLAKQGQEVHFLLNTDFDFVRERGLTVDSILGDFHLPSPHVYKDIKQMPPCDVVLVALKSVHNGLLKDWLPSVLAEDGVVLTLQNGLDVERDCVDVLHRIGVQSPVVMGGCCFLCSNKVGPGHISHLDYGRIVFGRYGAESNEVTQTRYAKQILDSMREAKIDANWTDELSVARWRKLMWNIPFNGLSVVLDASTDQIIACEASRQLADRVIREVHAGASFCGVEVDPSAIEKTMSHTETMVPYDSSMRLDYRHGRAMEIEAIFGNPLRAVSAAGENSAMPCTRMLYQQLRFLDARRGATIES